MIRESVIAGSWYPGNEKELNKMIDGFFNKVEEIKIDNIVALIAPHAGYVYSGQTAAYGFKLLKGYKFKTVIVIAPSHREYFIGGAIPEKYTHFKTPLGKIKISEKALKLAKEQNFTANDTPHRYEHSLEIELPFLQKTLGEFELIPIIVGGNTSLQILKDMGKTLLKYIDKDTLIVASSDFTHYGSNFSFIPFTTDIENNLKKLDYGAIDFITKIDPDGFFNYVQKTSATICGENPITVLLALTKEMSEKTPVKAELVHYDTSGRITDDFDNSVSYASIVFNKMKLVENGGEKSKEVENKSGVGALAPSNKKNELNKDEINKHEREYLLKLARRTIEEHLKSGKKPKVDESELDASLKEKKGCFVTLHKKGDLRGCIGHIIPEEELYQCVIENAINAAVKDPRFPEVTEKELKDIDVEVSVLTVPKKLEYKDAKDLLQKLRPNIDGVIIKSGWNQATFLPQVWEQLTNKEQFLSHLCMKAGLSADYWKTKKLEVEIYQAEVFGEKE